MCASRMPRERGHGRQDGVTIDWLVWLVLPRVDRVAEVRVQHSIRDGDMAPASAFRTPAVR